MGTFTRPIPQQSQQSLKVAAIDSRKQNAIQATDKQMQKTTMKCKTHKCTCPAQGVAHTIISNCRSVPTYPDVLVNIDKETEVKFV